jgi:hypothetical protein
MELYAETMIYPRWSRPADGATRHLLEWNRMMPIGQAFAADAEGREISVELALDKLFAGPGESLSATASIYRSLGAERAPVAPDRLAGRVEMLDPDKGWVSVADVAFTASGDTFTASFTPGTIPQLAERPREAQFVAEVHLGEFFKVLPLTFRYAAEAPFVVRRVIGDRATKGALEIDLDVEVKYAAPTLVQAGLYDGAGTRAIAVYDDYFRPVRTGRQIVTLRFFGKTLADAHIDGPYRLRAVHGLVMRPGEEPGELFWSFPDDPRAMTAAHRASTFSDDEWTSDEKERKLTQYRDFVRDTALP